MKKIFDRVLYEDKDFLYGSSKFPVETKNGIIIGGGKVLPELNFTLPTMTVDKLSEKKVIEEYKSIITDASKRAVDLKLEEYIVEVELVPQATYDVNMGIEIVKTLREVMFEYENKNGIKSALRLTPVDIREDAKSEHMWHGNYYDKIMEVFKKGSNAGADLLSIESIGGKDVHDEAVMYCNIRQAIFGLGVLGTRDMSHLWEGIVNVANQNGSIAAGDTACGFANTAMVLADKGYIPKVFAAVIRVLAAVRSLVAYEEGAKGPHKDCGYEGVYIKAITGTPISMEGKSSACAHLSSLGNISLSVADLWSNESVQNVKLLGGMTPTISLEQLIYDCRLVNTAKKHGNADALKMRNYLVESDSHLDPQAYVLRPDVVLRISDKLVKEKTHYERSKTAVREACIEIRKGIEENKLDVAKREYEWLSMIEDEVEKMPSDEQELIDEMTKNNTIAKFTPEKYDL